MDISSQDQLKHSAAEYSNPRKRTEEDDIHTLPTSRRKCRDSRAEEDLIEHVSQDETSRLDLDFEERDIAGLPWWFLENLGNNSTLRSNGSTDLQTNQDIGTAIVSDTTDELWLLNETVSEQLGVGIKVEAANSEQASEVEKTSDEKTVEVEKDDDLEESKSLRDDTDVEVTPEDERQCTEPKNFNFLSKTYCFRFWTLRKDDYSDRSELTPSVSSYNITIVPEKDNEGINVPDRRGTISAPVAKPKDGCLKEEKPRFNPCNSVEILDSAHRSESQEIISSTRAQTDIFSEQKTETESMEDFQNVLKPCSLCEKRPRDGNIIHGKTSHLTTCFHCARRLKQSGASCPACKKEIQLVIKVFIA